MEEKKKLKNEYAVGESFSCGKIELECVAGDSCLHCYFGDFESCDAVDLLLVNVLCFTARMELVLFLRKW